MLETLIYRKYQRHIHHVLTTLHLFHISCDVTFRALRSSTLYGSHPAITIIPCAPAIIPIVA
ncbi:hypothetical protein Hanom_Chr13g01242361 [Helianthus anomalus]